MPARAIQESKQFIKNLTEALQITFIPFEGLLQSSGWATFVAAFIESLGSYDAVRGVVITPRSSRDERSSAGARRYSTQSTRICSPN